MFKYRKTCTELIDRAPFILDLSNNHTLHEIPPLKAPRFHLSPLKFPTFHAMDESMDKWGAINQAPTNSRFRFMDGMLIDV
jgi:hypothetical protein